MKALLFLFCCYSVCVSAQAPYLQRTGSENNFRRIDPFGCLPSAFNNPLPLSYGFSTTSPIVLNCPQADYYVSTADNCWKYENTHQFLYNEFGTVQEERRINKFTGQLEGRIIYERDKKGLLTTVSEYAISGTNQNMQLTAQRLLTYEEQSGILLSDSTLDFVKGSWHVSGVRLTRSPDNKLKYVAVYSEKNGTLNHQGFFEFSYKGDSLDEIIQFIQDENGNKTEPVYRLYNFTGILYEPFHISGYTSAWMENGEWKDYRIDKCAIGPTKKIFEGKLLSGTEAGSIIENTVDFDEQKNVTRISQKRIIGDAVELIGELNYELSYKDGQTRPSIITTTYLDEHKNKRNSLRVIGQETESFISATNSFSFTVFPNPATDFVTIQWQNNRKPLNFELVTGAGAVVASLTTIDQSSATALLSLKGIAPGFYRLNGFDGERYTSAPLIILERK